MSLSLLNDKHPQGGACVFFIFSSTVLIIIVESVNHEELRSHESPLTVMWHKLSLELESRNLSVVILNRLLMVW